MNKHEKSLLNLFRQLTPESRENLKLYAEFLLGRQPQQAAVPQQPLDLPRPDNETVIGAIKRLSANYPMLNKDNLLHETSGLMTRHMLHGQDASEVIDELEIIFRKHYDKLCAEEKSLDSAKD